jgi:hypothetical protein
MRQPRPASRRFGEHGSGVMSAWVFDEMVLKVFETKKEFAEYTGISVAQVQRYATGVSPVPKAVALLVASLALLKRRQIPMPDLAELGPPVRAEQAGPIEARFMRLRGRARGFLNDDDDE